MLNRTTDTIILSLCFYMLLIVWSPVCAEEKKKQEPPPEPVTISDPSIPVDELELLVKPLIAEELFIEADAWLGLLKAKVAEISRAEIAVKKKNKETKQSEVKQSIDEAKQALNEVEKKEAKAQADGTQEAAENVTEAAKAASEAVETVTDTAEKAADAATETKSEEIVPNNSIWGNTITNITGSEQRRVDLVFGISYSDDIDQAQKILEDIVNEHPLVLDEPEPTIKIDELADSSVNFICRPWVKTADFGPVRWDIIRAVKERFDQAGISIPYPQRDIHIFNTTANSEPAPVQGTTEKDKKL